ncbi:bifunctional glutamate N-acetyltransferase/amino-acid acetyltransferase ArgJ [Kurthia huakuii]|uniref:bifunctional glutamate N-acetyltransferase/amino-acid acetyltransferase ArgJ n=1 Tax=Kurthia huakuii TaxID=1421019 RepID=UPI000495D7FA|nr:bifunctional glutamate N-acetyltransferase/amino-acid acetyltransferase ArgJ [Kurthia huakuii]MBM7698107.1 glutamate N-acetyltransferase/amino-acid N-acetyltransferase [Kurthia huakuii]
MTTVDVKQVVAKHIVSPKGFTAAGMHCGVKHKKKDLALLFSEVPASVAGVFTTNAIKAAPVIVTKETIYASRTLQAVVLNSGNANACTGKQGLADAKAMQQLVADKLQIPANTVGVCSTGVIGQHLPMEPITNGIQAIELGDSVEHGVQFAEALLTTDTMMKNSAYTVTVDGKQVTVAGTAKGSGMIEPNMATMLGVITTDANIDSDTLQALLASATTVTFNAITVDGDTSTNDTVLALANGLAGNESLTPEHADWTAFKEAFRLVSQDLAKMIAKDGEGATKLIETTVVGAATNDEALKIAKTVVGSPLVKTAVFGNDANWGRILAAVGYSGCTIDPTNVFIKIGDEAVVDGGEPLDFSEAYLLDYLKQPEIKIVVDLHVGEGQGKAWGCDLTYDYVQINATYRS